MARWVQVWNKELGKSEFIPKDEAAVRLSGTTAVHGDIESFVSPIDGSVISDRKQLREHNKRHGVVNSAEFNPEYLEKKKKEREDLHQGIRQPDQIRRDKMEIWETIHRLERNG